MAGRFMIYRTATALRQALDSRLVAESRRSSVELWRLRKRVAADRLLAALAAVAPGRWILKGGVALDLRFGDRARETRDLDLGSYDSESAALADFHAVERYDGSDFFVSSIRRTDHLDNADVAGAVRFHVRLLLAGRVFEELTVDVGFSSTGNYSPEQILGSELLAFSGIPRIIVPVIPLAQHIAEKVHAYTRQYGPDGRQSTRVKDLVDLVLIQANATLIAGDVRSALQSVFSVRDSQQLPQTLPPPPANWQVPYRRMANGVGIVADLRDGYQLAAAFLDPVLDGSTRNTQAWNPARAAWGDPPES
jgi:hypothetical protein